MPHQARDAERYGGRPPAVAEHIGWRMNSPRSDAIFRAVDQFRIELPSWGFANTGTRFGKFLQPAAAVTLEEKFSDAAHVHELTGVCPTLALHVLWDLPA